MFGELVFPCSSMSVQLGRFPPKQIGYQDQPIKTGNKTYKREATEDLKKYEEDLDLRGTFVSSSPSTLTHYLTPAVDGSVLCCKVDI